MSLCKGMLNGPDGLKRETITDEFGNFRFDGLDRGGGPFVVRTEETEKSAVTGVGLLGKSRFVGTLLLK